MQVERDDGKGQPAAESGSEAVSGGAGGDAGGTVAAREAAPAAADTALAALLAERDQIQDRYLRLAAEYDNFRKRTAREWQEHRGRATAEVLLEMLELADNLERALTATPEDAAALRRGVELIAAQLQAKLRRFGVEALEAAGQEFDPTRHEAVLMVDSDTVASHHVVDIVQRGYSIDGAVLRPARVTVAR